MKIRTKLKVTEKTLPKIFKCVLERTPFFISDMIVGDKEVHLSFEVLKNKKVNK